MLNIPIGSKSSLVRRTNRTSRPPSTARHTRRRPNSPDRAHCRRRHKSARPACYRPSIAGTPEPASVVDVFPPAATGHRHNRHGGDHGRPHAVRNDRRSDRKNANPCSTSLFMGDGCTLRLPWEGDRTFPEAKCPIPNRDRRRSCDQRSSAGCGFAINETACSAPARSHQGQRC